MGLMKNGKLEEYFPPGYEHEKERTAAMVLLGTAGMLSLQYFMRLNDAVNSLYYIDKNLGKTIKEGVAADPFLHLVWAYGGLFLPFFLFLVIMTVNHYAYYYRDTKSFYLMKRLPKRGVMMKSCVQAPLFGIMTGVALLVILCLIYYGAYLLAIPKECHPRFV